MTFFLHFLGAYLLGLLAEVTVRWMKPSRQWVQPAPLRAFAYVPCNMFLLWSPLDGPVTLVIALGLCVLGLAVFDRAMR